MVGVAPDEPEADGAAYIFDWGIGPVDGVGDGNIDPALLGAGTAKGSWPPAPIVGGGEVARSCAGNLPYSSDVLRTVLPAVGGGPNGSGDAREGGCCMVTAVVGGGPKGSGDVVVAVVVAVVAGGGTGDDGVVDGEGWTGGGTVGAGFVGLAGCRRRGSRCFLGSVDTGREPGKAPPPPPKPSCAPRLAVVVSVVGAGN